MMSTNMHRYAACLALLTGCASLAHAAPTCTNPVGKWKNELGSTLIVSEFDAPSGKISGNYISPSGTTGATYPMVGWINNAPASKSNNRTVFTFSVRWGSYGSVTAWTGTCIDGTSYKPAVITTLWHLARGSSDYSWDHVLTNSDGFVALPD
ncbi:avidin/streptavidin family protein [Xanthomonas sp. MUS 060]|uniref:avidin/streptavidin family protein n=1 Tax=Xanthomonas sp. MUS 060 TaxID=1588031 RepID=UPI0009E41E0C